MDANRSADAPYFSVVIPTYNRAHIIRGTIDSVLGQTDPDFEVIVVDDGGTDATEEVVRAVPDARVSYHRKDNAERAAARNFGAARARGRYVEFLDSDDVFYPYHLAAARRLIAAAGDPEIVHLGYEMKDSAGAVVGRAGPFEGALNEYLPNGNVLSCRGVLLRSDVARSFPFNEDRDLSGSEDWELWLRLASRFHIAYSNEVTSAILGHDARSVLTADERSLVRRMDLTLGYLRQDEAFLAAFGDRQSDVEAEFLSYIALHLALRREPLRALRYAARSLRMRPRSAFSRRFLAIGKHVLLGTVARQRRPRRP